MAFDKKQYWKNRKAGIRGQGVMEKPVIDMNSDDWKKHNGDGKHVVQIGKQLVYTNRAVARKLGQ